MRLSIGILSWNNPTNLEKTLSTYCKGRLLDITDDIFILFQEVNDLDKKIANKYSIKYIGLNKNLGIGKGFTFLAKNAKYDTILLLEDDFHLIENHEKLVNRLKSGLYLLSDGFDIVRYRHRKYPGIPMFSKLIYQRSRFDKYDNKNDCFAPYLLDSLHWLDPSKKYPDKIQKRGEYFITSSRWASWTNNPIMLKTDFFVEYISPFSGNGADLEENIAQWWSSQNFKIAHGEGLFSHVDNSKYDVKYKIKYYLNILYNSVISKII